MVGEFGVTNSKSLSPQSCTIGYFCFCTGFHSLSSILKKLEVVSFLPKATGYDLNYKSLHYYVPKGNHDLRFWRKSWDFWYLMFTRCLCCILFVEIDKSPGV